MKTTCLNSENNIYQVSYIIDIIAFTIYKTYKKSCNRVTKIVRKNAPYIDL